VADWQGSEKLGPNTIAWVESEIDEMIARRIAERDAAGARAKESSPSAPRADASAAAGEIRKKLGHGGYRPVPLVT
jgi:hypothetical protein